MCICIYILYRIIHHRWHDVICRRSKLLVFLWCCSWSWWLFISAVIWGPGCGVRAVVSVITAMMGASWSSQLSIIWYHATWYRLLIWGSGYIVMIFSCYMIISLGWCYNDTFHTSCNHHQHHPHHHHYRHHDMCIEHCLCGLQSLWLWLQLRVTIMSVIVNAVGKTDSDALVI